MRVLLPNVDFYLDIYCKNSAPTSKYYAICSHFARRSRRMIVLVYNAFLCSSGIAFLTGAFDVWRSHGSSQIMQIYVPGVDVFSSLPCIVLLTLLNSAVFVLAVICFAPVDMFFFLVFGNVPLVAAIVHNQMDELTARLRSGEHTAAVKQYFLHFIGIHHKHKE